MSKINSGKFIISLDFELMWGVRDKRTIEQYGAHILGVHAAIPKMLELFEKYLVKATFSTVGFLFFENKKELLENLPSILPSYTDHNLNPYTSYISELDENDSDNKYHFASKLINEIKKHKIHEIGTHTFSHFYCLESGQTEEAFKADLEFAKQIALKKGIEVSSLVFPRNQFNQDYLSLCNKMGIQCVRGNPNSWLYKERINEEESIQRRIIRLLDSYINLSGYNSFPINEISKQLPIIIPASRFLRPYSTTLDFLEPLRLRRIKNSMTNAARKNQLYHLWWHPHNFGINQEQNFSFLEQILIHFSKLRDSYHFTSNTMIEMTNSLISNEKSILI